jgi:hypothetical protein
MAGDFTVITYPPDAGGRGQGSSPPVAGSAAQREDVGKLAGKSTQATLGGVALTDQVSVGWSELAGSQPYQRVFEVDLATAGKLFASVGLDQGGQGGGTPQSTGSTVSAPPGTTGASGGAQAGPGGELQLSITAKPSGRTYLAKALSVLHEVASSTPYLRAFVVSDRRWRWPYAHVERRYNVPLDTGDRREVSGQLIQVVGAQPTYKYAVWSLNPKTKQPWTAKDMVVDVLSVVALDPTGKADFRIEDGSIPPLTIEDVVIDDWGDAAVDRVLAYLPATAIKIEDKTGTAVVYDRLSGKESDQLSKAGPPVAPHSPLAVLVNRVLVRPAKVVSRFERRHEIRLDYTEATSPTTSPDQLQADNVLPFPDQSGTLNGQTIAQGTWLTVQEALSIWNADTANPPPNDGNGNSLPLTLDIIQELWNSEGTLENFYTLGTGFFNVVWARRIAAIRAHYRQTFRVDPRARSRFYGWAAERLAVINVANDTRAPAQAFFDFAVRIGQRIYYAAASRGNQRDFNFAENVFCDSKGLSSQNVPWTGKGSKLADGVPAPAVIDLVDPDVGIFHVTLKADLSGNALEFLPCAIRDDANFPMPTSDMSDPHANTMEFAKLVAGFSITLLVSAYLAAPNDQRRFLEVEVDPVDVFQLGVKTQLLASGPKHYERIGNNVEEAWVAWSDDQRDLIEKSVGIQPGPDKPLDLSALVLNQDRLDAVAKATAARVYAMMADRNEGARVSAPLDPDRSVQGSVSMVSHELGTDGTTTTQMTLAPIGKPADFWAWVPDSIRRFILRTKGNG